MASLLSSALHQQKPSPLIYENWSYQDQWDKIKSQKDDNDTHTTDVVFDLHWLQNKNQQSRDSSSSSNLLLLGCTSEGEVCCWKTPPSRNDDDDENDFSSQQKPIWRRRISSSTLYSVQVIQAAANSSKELLVASGDEGVLIYDWNKCLLNDEFTFGGAKSKKNQKQQSSLEPLARFQPYKSPYEKSIEINSVQWDAQSGHLFGAAGDAFGCYKWDLERQELVATYTSPATNSSGYLHTMELVPDLAVSGSNNTVSSSQLLLTGGEDGLLGIWDTKADKLVESIDMNKAIASGASSLSISRNQTPQSPRGQRPQNAVAESPSTSRWISCCKVVNDTWWTVGGGSSGPTSGGGKRGTGAANSNTNSKGFLATFHAPTRSLVTSVETRECIQQLAVEPTDRTLWSVGNESFASHWGEGSPYTLDDQSNRRRISCTAPSLYAVDIATNPMTASQNAAGQGDDSMDVDMEASKGEAGTSYVAVSGVGPTIDVLEDGGQPSFRFHL